MALHPGILIVAPGTGRGGLSLSQLVDIVRPFAAWPESTQNRLFAWNANDGLHEVR